MLTILSILLVFAVWLLLGFKIIRENENAVVVFLGKPRRTVTSGLVHTWWPFEYVRKFTTELMELEFRRAGIITKAAEFEQQTYGAANICLDTTMYFRWPTGDNLLETVKIVGNPENKDTVRDFFEETVLDAYRSEGGRVTWREITQDRKTFSDDVTAALIDEPSDPLNQARIPQESVRLVIKHLELPKNLEEAITKPEVARMEGEAFKTKSEFEGEGNKKRTILEGEGSKEKIMREGEGKADARKKLYEAIGKEPENIQKEVLLTLREMAQGTSNTILFPIPSEITDVLSDIFGKGTAKGLDLKKIMDSLSVDQKSLLLKWLSDEFKKGGSQ